MKAVTGALRSLDFPRERRHQEKFVSLGGNPFGDAVAAATATAEIAAADADDEPGVAWPTTPASLEVELDGAEYSFDDWAPAMKMLDFLESKGVKAPFSCREGECSACAFRLLEGEVQMEHNDVLDDEDLADGIRLGCQSHPTSDSVKVSYS
jgi:3-ketosteroid 9alpha-monooxygenase subunit B